MRRYVGGVNKKGEFSRKKCNLFPQITNHTRNHHFAVLCLARYTHQYIRQERKEKLRKIAARGVLSSFFSIRKCLVGAHEKTERPGVSVVGSRRRSVPRDLIGGSQRETQVSSAHR
jgi:hypothetical protein